MSLSAGSVAHAAASSSPSYPLTYRLSLLWRMFFQLGGGLFLLAGLFAAAYFGTGHEVHSPREAVALSGIGVAFALLGGYLLAFGLRFRVVLHADAIEVFWARRTQRLGRDEIAGRRLVQHRYFRQLTFVTGRGGKRLQLPLLIKTAAAFDAWVAAIPDLDDADLQRAEAEIQKELGDSADAKDKLTRASGVAKVLNLVGIAAAAWGFMSPQPYEVVIATLAILPWVAVAAVVLTRGLIRLDGRRNDPHPHLLTLFLAPTGALILRSISDIQIVDWRPFVVPVVGGATLLVALVAAADSRLRKTPASAFMLILFSCALFWGTLTQANALLDRAPEEVHPTEVTEKRAARGNHDSYYLVLAWSPRSDHEVAVGRALFDHTAQGETVLVHLRPGAFGMPWFYVTAR